MCTAVSYQAGDHYFGRNLDLDYHYHETVTIAPRNFPFRFRHVTPPERHYAVIGMAYVAEGEPLYYDAVNEKGLCIAGLNFPGNARYFPPQPGKTNLCTFELIPWLLGQCATVAEARPLLMLVNLVDEQFRPELPLTPLHWLLCDGREALTLEPMEDALRLYENPAGVLTNNPPFPMQMSNLNRYMILSAKQPENRFSPALPLQADSLGLGAFGLPGDLSSDSRFVRAAFTRANSVSGPSEAEHVSQFFHILDAVAQTRGCNCLEGGRYEITVYSACCNVDRGIYYYSTYENRQISAVDLHREDLEGRALVSYPLITQQQIQMQN